MSRKSGTGFAKDMLHQNVYMSRAFHIEHGSRSSRIGTGALAIALLALIAAPAFAGRDDLRLMSEIFTYIALASLWNLLAGYAGLVSVGQQAYVGLGGYVLFAATILAGMHPLAAVPLAGVDRGGDRDPGCGIDVSPARTLFRDRHVGRRGGLSPAWHPRSRL